MKYTREILEPIVKASVSVAEVCRKLGVATHGGSCSHVSRCIDKLGIDRSHFRGRGHSKGKTFGFSYPTEEYLSNKRSINSNRLRLRLTKEGLKPDNCEKCGLSDWLGVKLPLELHHIDCNHDDNRLENLLVVCPNCHAIIHKEISDSKTKTKTRKNYRSTPSKQEKSEKKKPELIGDNVRVAYPRPNKRTIERPPYEQLLKEVSDTSYSAVGRKYGVSDNAIRKWIRIYEKYQSSSGRERADT
jgi:hypothetical protein